ARRRETRGGLVDQLRVYKTSRHRGRANVLTVDDSVVSVPEAEPDHDVRTDLRQPSLLVLRDLPLARRRPAVRGAGDVEGLAPDDAAARDRSRIELGALLDGSLLQPVEQALGQRVANQQDLPRRGRGGRARRSGDGRLWRRRRLLR